MPAVDFEEAAGIEDFVFVARSEGTAADLHLGLGMVFGVGLFLVNHL